MTEPQETVTVFASDDAVAQSAVMNLLTEHGIPSFLNNVYLRDVLGFGPLGYNPAAGAATIEVAAEHAESAEQLVADYLDDLEQPAPLQEVPLPWDDEPQSDQDIIETHQKAFNRRLIIGFFCLFLPLFAIGPALALVQLWLARNIARAADCSLSGWIWFWLLAAIAIPLFLISALWTLALIGIGVG